ncbi:MAG: AAA family ATPase, partial [Victivallales bacterium]|nr:AAA family ATPase [Victivallales bacterium]
MLETLQIRNLALVQSLEIDFGAGLNTITGETGAGKSLVIGAIQLLAGARANPSSIRKGEKSCEVAGIFNLEHVLPEIKEGIAEKLQEADLPPCDEDRLLIRRIVTENGSKAYVNGSMVTAGFLKELCGNLIDLHGPHDNQTLLLNSRQLHLLDIYAGLSTEEAELKSMYHHLSQLRRQKEDMQSQGLAPEEQSLLEYQLQEIEKADLEGLDEDELLSRYKVASNSRRLVEMAAGAAEALSE